MSKLWALLSGVGAALLLALKIVTGQRDKAREEAAAEKRQREADAAVRESEHRIQNRQAAVREAAKVVGDELEQNRGQRPVGSFGDSRLRQPDQD